MEDIRKEREESQMMKKFWACRIIRLVKIEMRNVKGNCFGVIF